MHIKHMFSTVLRRAALAVTLAAGSSLASAAVIHVDVDTSNFGVPAGYIDMQLSASDSGVPLATVLVSNMIGFDPSAFIDSWGVTSSGGGYLFRSDTANDLFHAVTFGGVLSFDLTFAGEVDPLTTYVSHFVVAAFDQAFAPLGMFDPVHYSLAEFSWTPAMPNGIDGNIGVSISDAAVTVIPEPSGVLLSGIALAAICSLRRRAKPAATKERASLALKYAA
jgi:hypothetical protein